MVLGGALSVIHKSTREYTAQQSLDNFLLVDWEEFTNEMRGKNPRKLLQLTHKSCCRNKKRHNMLDALGGTLDTDKDVNNPVDLGVWWADSLPSQRLASSLSDGY